MDVAVLCIIDVKTMYNLLMVPFLGIHCIAGDRSIMYTMY